MHAYELIAPACPPAHLRAATFAPALAPTVECVRCSRVMRGPLCEQHAARWRCVCGYAQASEVHC